LPSTNSSRRWIQLAVGIALSALFLWLAVRGEDWGAIGAAMTQTDVRYLVLMAAAGVYALYVRCQRWRLLLERAGGRPLAMRPIFSASAIGFMANMVLPSRIGEFARPYLVSRSTPVPLSTSLATVVLERILDLFVLFSFGMWVVSASDVPDVVSQLTWVAGVVVGMLFAGIVVVHFQRRRLLPIVDRIWLMLPDSIGQVILRVEHEFLDALAVVADRVVFVKAMLWSFYVWLVIAITFSLGFLALGLDVPFLAGGVTVTTLVALAVSVPGAPGFVGQFEWGCKLALEQIYGVPGALAVAYSFVVHAQQWAVQVVVGLVYLVREGLSLNELERLQAEKPAGGEETA
jgi:uncharacterized protein (TIRG00374 family)